MQFENGSGSAPALGFGTGVSAGTAVKNKLSLQGTGRTVKLTCNGPDAEVLLSETSDGHSVFRWKLLIV